MVLSCFSLKRPLAPGILEAGPRQDRVDWGQLGEQWFTFFHGVGRGPGPQSHSLAEPASDTLSTTADGCTAVERGTQTLALFGVTGAREEGGQGGRTLIQPLLGDGVGVRRNLGDLHVPGVVAV